MTTTKVRRKNNTFYVILITEAVALGGFLFGYDTAAINGAVGALAKAFHTISWLTGLAVSLLLLGAAVGAFYAGGLADRYGRVRVMVVASVLFTISFTISTIGTGLTVEIWDCICGRLLGRIAVGIASVVAPTYITECAPADLCGLLGSLQQLVIVLGTFIALLCDHSIAVSADSATAPFVFGIPTWRWMFWSATAPAIIYGIAALMIPESPRYLVAEHWEPEAVSVPVVTYAHAQNLNRENSHSSQAKRQVLQVV